MGTLVEEGGMLQVPVQPQTLPETPLQLPSLPFLPPPQPRLACQGVGHANHWLCLSGCQHRTQLPPGSQVFGCLEPPPAPRKWWG